MSNQEEAQPAKTEKGKEKKTKSVKYRGSVPGCFVGQTWAKRVELSQVYLF